MKNSAQFLNEWADAQSAFPEQLALNRRQLDGDYPAHWLSLLSVLQSLLDRVTRIVDVGCGAGALRPLCLRHFPYMEYIGYDYASAAVELATKTWGEFFVVKNYIDLTPDDFGRGDILVANALADVLPNGDDCIKHLLSLGVDHLHLQRVKLTHQKSYFSTYKAYDITTYAYYHNVDNLNKLFSKYKYTATSEPLDGESCNFLLSRKLSLNYI